jgi:chromosome segregation protein
LREDYEIDLAALHETASGQEHEVAARLREDVEQEIEALRRKIHNLGSVNLEALTELDELEARWSNLSRERDDLNEAKTNLEEIIQKINNDSRRLFAETLEVVRGHFQELFRKLFGGGRADIVLEEGIDILDAGIDIIARPPGKELRNISLLSGGEKTLTAVALLLAIFRSQPSPFCVLDEVDAALDEANIDRFLVVLREFLSWTQFIIITHSKRTMLHAGVLYGVTMEESGVSKRVAVRFEDIGDDGHFKTPAEELEPAAQAKAAGAWGRAEGEPPAEEPADSSRAHTEPVRYEGPETHRPHRDAPGRKESALAADSPTDSPDGDDEQAA